MDSGSVLEWLQRAHAYIKSIESLILLGGLFIAWFLLRRERLKIHALVERLGKRVEELSRGVIDLSQNLEELGQRVETSIQQSKAAIETAESALAQPSVLVPANGNSHSHWEQVRADWQNVRDRLELAVERIPHKGTRGKYGRLTRYNYNDVIIALRDDGEIGSEKAFHALIGMNGLFLKLRSRPGNATAGDVARFKEWLRDVNGSLPKLPAAKLPSVDEAAE